MLKRKLLLASALVGVELIAMAGGAQAGNLAGVRGTHSVNLGSMNYRNIGGSRQAGLNVYSPVNINNKVNSSTNISVNKPLNVYAPVNVTNNVDNSTNISSTVNINNAKYIDNSTNVTVNKEINVSTTNIFNGMGSGNSHSHNRGGHLGQSLRLGRHGWWAMAAAHPAATTITTATQTATEIPTATETATGTAPTPIP